MKTDQPEQSHAFLDQSTKVLLKNQETEESDATTTSMRDNRSHSPLNIQDTQTNIAMTKEKDNNLSSRKWGP